MNFKGQKKGQNKAWNMGDSSFLLSKNRKNISGEAARSQKVLLKTNYIFGYKFLFSKIWPSLDFAESHKTS